MLIDKTLADFLNDTASSSPAPGGGTVSALAGSLAAALTSMVCHLTIGKKKYAEVETLMKETLEKSETVRAGMQEIIDADTEAFNGVMRAFALPKESDAEKQARSAAIQDATKQATEVPLRFVRACGTCVELVETAAHSGNRNSVSDAGVAALLLAAAVRGAALNVYINLSALSDASFVRQAREECTAIEQGVTTRCEAVARTVKDQLTA